MTTWKKDLEKNKYPALKRSVSADVIIIGGGLTGILNAYSLNKAGLKVIVIEKSEIGSNATMYTTAFITKVIDTPLHEICSIFDERTGYAVWESGQTAIEEYEKIIREEKIDCEFMRCSNFIYAGNQRQRNKLEKEYEAYKKLGIKSNLGINSDGLPFRNYGYMEVPNQAKFHVFKFLYRMTEILHRRGVEIYENTEAIDVLNESQPIKVVTKYGNIEAKNIIYATYRPFTNKKTHLKKGMYVSYVLEAEIRQNLFPEAIYEDLSNPYYYWRIDKRKGLDRLILGGEDHKDIFGKALQKKSFEALEEYLRKLLPDEKFKIKEKWDGPVLEPSDGLALIGEIASHHYVATAFSGNGMTYAMISSLLIHDMILSKTNSFETWKKAYDPKRTLLHPKRLASKARDYVMEFFGGAAKNLLK